MDIDQHCDLLQEKGLFRKKHNVVTAKEVKFWFSVYLKIPRVTVVMRQKYMYFIMQFNSYNYSNRDNEPKYIYLKGAPSPK